jgi:hypothetical protein
LIEEHRNTYFQSRKIPSPTNPGFESPKGSNALVTGFVGPRLIEMLLERNAKTVIGFDIMAPNSVWTERFKAVQKKRVAKSFC